MYTLPHGLGHNPSKISNQIQPFRNPKLETVVQPCSDNFKILQINPNQTCFSKHMAFQRITEPLPNWCFQKNFAFFQRSCQIPHPHRFDISLLNLFSSEKLTFFQSFNQISQTEIDLKYFQNINIFYITFLAFTIPSWFKI